MKKIGLLSDTHGYLDPQVFEFFADRDEIWHAGDFGTPEVSNQLSDFKPLRGVFGNVDDAEIRDRHPQHQRFFCEELDVWITHIGGHPKRYDPQVRKPIQRNPPQLFIAGHSHILRIERDLKLGNMLHLNPGAAGRYGVHTVRTLLRFEVAGDRVQKMQVVELGPSR